MKNVAVEGMVVTYKVVETPVTVVATLGPASPHAKVDGKGIYLDGLLLTAASWSIPQGQLVYAGVGPMTASFSSSAEYVNVDGKKVLLDGDTATLSVTATNTENPEDTRSFTITATISDSGQANVTAE